jgi:hypothetical protein
MSRVGVRRFVSVVGALAALALPATVLAPAAQADHIDAVQLCTARYAGTFNFLDKRRISPEDNPLGYVVIAHQRRDGKNRTCAVTVREHHNRVRFAAVAIRRVSGEDGPWKRKTARNKWGAGPVVVTGRCVSVRATIGETTRPDRIFCYES